MLVDRYVYRQIQRLSQLGEVTIRTSQTGGIPETALSLVYPADYLLINARKEESFHLEVNRQNLSPVGAIELLDRAINLDRFPDASHFDWSDIPFIIDQLQHTYGCDVRLHGHDVLASGKSQFAVYFIVSSLSDGGYASKIDINYTTGYCDSYKEAAMKLWRRFWK